MNVPFAALNTTALMTSSYHGHTDVVKVLLEQGANVHAVDLQQSTALGYAFGGKNSLHGQHFAEVSFWNVGFFLPGIQLFSSPSDTGQIPVPL